MISLNPGPLLCHPGTPCPLPRTITFQLILASTAYLQASKGIVALSLRIGLERLVVRRLGAYRQKFFLTMRINDHRESAQGQAQPLCAPVLGFSRCDPLLAQLKNVCLRTGLFSACLHVLKKELRMTMASKQNE